MNWEKGVSQFTYYAPRLSLKEQGNNKKKEEVQLTKTVFIPNSETVVTATSNGMILVWDRSLIIEGLGEQNEKRVIKTVPLNNNQKPINILTTHLNYLVCGNYEGTIRFYDFNFKIKAWFEDCCFSNIKSISFSQTEPKACSEEGYNIDDGGQTKEKEEPFKCSDFLVADDNALVCMLQSPIFDEIDVNKKKGHTIMQGIKSAISALAVHPTETKLAIAGADGFILLWDYMKKIELIHNYEQMK